MIQNYKSSKAEVLGELIKNEAEINPHFYLFSPDETTSNKLGAMYEATSRLWNTKKEPWDLKESDDGHIVELLSENVLFAMMLGHILSGEPAMMTSYESFFSIITSQIMQHLKFLEQSKTVAWRTEIPAVNLLSTSTCWRQDHNGFSHQSPVLISTLLSRPDYAAADGTASGNGHVNCLFPVDENAMRECFNFMMSSNDVVNLVTFNKTNEPNYIDENHAKFQYQYGASIFGFCSDGNSFIPDENEKFDVILTAAGDIASRECIEAISILREEIPEIRIRFIGINALTYCAIGTTNNKMPQEIFNKYFTLKTPIISAFQGYPETLKNILSCYTEPKRIISHGYLEQGSTTTPFEMLTKNRSSRYDFIVDVATILGRDEIVDKYKNLIQKNHECAMETGQDLADIDIL